MTPQVCIANIGPAQRRRRYRSGVIGLALGGAILAAPAITEVAPTLVAVAGAGVLLGGFIGVFQARGQT